MNFNLEDSKVFMSHILLSDEQVASAVSDTSLWINDKKLTAKLEVNGVEVPAEVLEEFIKGLWGNLKTQFEREYKTKTIDQKVEEKALELLKERGDNVMDKLTNLINVLSDPENLVTPYWERK